MRKVFAVIFSIITIFAIKECLYLFTTNDVEITSKRAQFVVTALSITFPLFIFSLWLWMPKR